MKEEFSINQESIKQETNNTNNNKKPVGLIVIIILVIIVGCCLVFTDIPKKIEEKMYDSSTATTTITTTTTANKKETTTKETTIIIHSDNIIKYDSIDSFVNYANNKNNGVLDNIGTILRDGSFKELKYDVDDKCKEEGDKISFNSQGVNVEYICTNKEVRETFNVWNVNVKLNGKYRDKEDTTQTCQSVSRYTNGKYLIRIHENCSASLPMGVTVVSLDTGRVVHDTGYYIYFYEDENNYRNSTKKTPLIVKNNVLYYVEPDLLLGHYTKCRIRYIDFNEQDPKVIDLTKPIDCYSPNEQ